MSASISQVASHYRLTAAQRSAYIEAVRPFAPTQSERRLMGLVEVVRACNNWKTHHIFDSDAIAINNHVLRETLGRNYLQWTDGLIIRSGSYDFRSGAKNHTMKTTVKPELANAVRNVELTFRSPSDLVWSDGEPHKVRGAVIGKSHGHLHNIPQDVPVDRTEIVKYCDVYSSWHEAIRDDRKPELSPAMYQAQREQYKQIAFSHRIEHRLKTAQTLLQLIDAKRPKRQKRNQGTTLQQHYHQSKTCPRFYGVGTNLQNAPRELRKAALNGCWHYDIAACHHRILQGFARRTDTPCPVIDHYLAEKSAFRAMLADYVGVSVPVIKQVMLAVIYGARFQWVESTDEIWIIRELIGLDRQKKLLEHREFKRLYAEIRQLFKVILHQHKPKHGNRGQVKNALGQLMPVKPKSEKQIAAFILQGIETQAMLAMLEVSPSALVAIHDGIVTREQIPTTTLEQAMYDSTGFKFTVEEQQISAPQYC